MKQSNDKGGIAMIPDKIYVKEFGEGISQMWGGIKATETAANVQHKYIRKEALLEWLESKIKDASNGGFVNGLITLAYKDVVEHINEM